MQTNSLAVVPVPVRSRELVGVIEFASPKETAVLMQQKTVLVNKVAEIISMPMSSLKHL